MFSLSTPNPALAREVRICLLLKEETVSAAILLISALLEANRGSNFRNVVSIASGVETSSPTVKPHL